VARLISFVKVKDNTVLLFSIYNKGAKDSISDKEIKELTNLYSWFQQLLNCICEISKYQVNCG
jgi:hypothetical protein